MAGYHIICHIAAFATQPENTPLTTITKPNLSHVHVGGVRVGMLVDIGAHISVMSSNLRRTVQKVMAPVIYRAVRVADGGTTTVGGTYADRVGIAGHEILVLFTVLDT